MLFTFFFITAILTTFLVGTCFAITSSSQIYNGTKEISTTAPQQILTEFTSTLADENSSTMTTAIYQKENTVVNTTFKSSYVEETYSSTSVLPPKTVPTHTTIQDRLGESLTLQQLDTFKGISTGSQLFALELFSKFSDYITPVGRDFMISPFSVWSLLLLITEGASGNSLTQLKKTLHLNDDAYLLRTAYQAIQNTLQ